MFALLVLAGVVVSVLPVGQTYWNDMRGASIPRTYVEAVTAAPDPQLEKGLALAQQYNANLKPEELADPWTTRGATGSADHDRYLGELADFGTMGRLRIPQIQVDLAILHDAGPEELARGIGHMYGTALPVGGAGTNAVLAGHTGMRARTFLDRLPEVKAGQEFFLDVYGRTLTYRVDTISIVRPTDIAAVRPLPGQDLVTLVTCTQDGRRLLVRGIRVHDTGQALAVTSPAPVVYDDSVQSWMVPRLGVGAAGLVLLGLVALTWILGDNRRRHASTGQAPTAGPSGTQHPPETQPEEASP